MDWQKTVLTSKQIDKAVAEEHYWNNLKAELVEWIAKYKDAAERHALAENPNESATYLFSLFERAGYRLIPELRK